MGYKTIILKKEDGVATITLNRPESANALNSELGKELIGALEEIEEDESDESNDESG